MRILNVPVKTEAGVHEVKVPKGAQPVGFVNRHGEATFLFVVDGDGSPASKPVKLGLTQGAGQLDHAGDAKYIGTAEMRGGQFLMHAWVITDGK